MKSKSMLVNLFCAAVIAGEAFANTGLGQRYWPRSAVLDKEEKFRMEWWPGTEEDIFFKLEVRTQGCVSIGFSKDGTLVDSDIFIGWVSDGRAYLQDRHAEGNQMPELDRRQDWELISGSENETHTVLVIRRKLNTCDPQDFALEYDNTVRVMHAYSLEDPEDEFNIHYHGFYSRGRKSFLLLQPEIPMETEVEYWDVMTNDFAVSPDWDTKYWVRFFKTPSLKEKRHVTTVEPRILGGNRGDYIHHIVMYECIGADPNEFEPHVGTDGYDYLNPNCPSVVKKCFSVYAVWAKGGGTLVLPDHIGFPLDPSPTKYFMLQVHYDNFYRNTGSPGQTGFRFHHTARLRQYDAGTWIIGSNIGPHILVPPGIPDFVVAGHTTPDCFVPAMPPEGVRLSSVLLHTHLLGRRVRIRHFRDNIELPLLVDNKHYDPEYQEFHQFQKEVLIRPYDQLTAESFLDSTNRTKTTLGGFSTREAMCLQFIIYYPKFEVIYGSASEIKKQTNVHYIGSSKLKSIADGNSDYDETFVDFMRDYDWKKTAIRRYENGVRFSEHNTACYLGNENKSAIIATISYPEDFQEYVDKPYCLVRT